MGLYRSQVRDAMVIALQNGQTLAGRNVYAPRDWPEEPVDLPSIIVTMPAETKQSWGPVGPKFNTTAHIIVLARLIGTTAMDAEAQIELMIDQIQNAILTDVTTLGLIEKFSMVDTRVAITDQGEDQLGEVSIDFAADFPEIFHPGIGQPLLSIKGTITTPGSETLQIDDVLPQP